MYKIILVDDEEEIRKSIIKRIKWEQLGFEIVGEAENGIEALEVIERTFPDIVITDIKMPYMDGIRLAEQIRYSYPTTKVVVISGFDDFQYAKEAIKLGILRYILKPINAIEMNELLRELKALLDEEIRSRKNLEKLKESYKRSLPVLKERFLNRWIEDTIEIDEIKENLELLEIKLEEQTLGVAVIALEQMKDELYQTLKNKSLLKLAIFNICEEIVEEQNLGIVFMKLDQIIILIPLEQDENVKSSSRLFVGLEKIRLAVNKYLNAVVTIGIGTACKEFTKLHESYNLAVNALQYRITIGSNKIIYIEDIEPSHPREINLKESEEKALLIAIKTVNEDEVRTVIKRIFESIENSHLTLNDYRIYSVSLISGVLRLVRTMNIEIEHILPVEQKFFTTIAALEDKLIIQEWLIDTCIAITREFSSKYKMNKNELIEKAIDYVNTNYQDESLNAEKICKHLHISTNYFSTLFKKHMKMTFVAYLTQLRIEHAKNLLKETNKKTFEIANLVGYTEGHYFSYVFKKVIGISPTEYRNE